MTKEQAEALAKFDPDYVVRRIRGRWEVWSNASNHVVEFDPHTIHAAGNINKKFGWEM